MGFESQKLYCYVDETGQDTGSNLFIVVCVISDAKQETIRQSLNKIEVVTKIGAKKWHTSRSPEKEKFIRTVIKERVANGDLFYSKFKKPVTFFLAMIETIEKALICKVHRKNYKAIIYVDGIDKKKAKELTSYLRKKGVKLKLARSIRDESESMIRLADRWAGCIRNALEGKETYDKILSNAEKIHYIKSL